MKIFFNLTCSFVLSFLFITSIGWTQTWTPSNKLEIANGSGFLRMTPVAPYSSNAPLEVLNLGYQGITGAMNLSFRIGFPYSTGVQAGVKLDLLKSLNGSTILATSENGSALGNVGMGITTPSTHYRADINGCLNIRNYNDASHRLSLGGSGGSYGAIGYGFYFTGTTNTYKYFLNDFASQLNFREGGFDFLTAPIGSVNGNVPFSNAMRIQQNGNVGIGTTNPGSYKLAVEGKIGAREVVVTTAAWADYVFENTYKLRPLVQVETFIKENKHLPEVPSAKEVEAKGINLGEMDALLLKKIEELTLYMIQLEKKNESLESEIETLKFKYTGGK